MELSKAAMSFGRLWPRAVSSAVEGCLRSAALSAESVSAKRQMTAMSLHQGRSWADMLSRAVSRLHPTPFAMDQTNKARALPEGAFRGAGIENLCPPSDFHNIGRRAWKTASDLWSQSHVHRHHSPPQVHLRPMCGCRHDCCDASFPQLHSAPERFQKVPKRHALF